MQTKVSVIIPVYNAELYLRQCLESVRGQTLREIEILCVDDGSTDGSRALLEEMAGRDSRIVVLEQENKGAGEARNLGLSRASGEYLAFLDADDFFAPDMLEKCTAALDAEGSDIVAFGAWQYDQEKNREEYMPWSLRIAQCPEHSPFSPLEMKEYLFNTFQTWPWNKVFRRAFIQEKGIRFQDVERTNDMAFVLSALALADRISVIDEPFVHYRVNTGTSLQQTNARAPLAFWDAYLETKRRLQAYGLYETYEQSFVNCVLGGLMYNLRSVKGTPAYDDILELVRYRAEDEFHFMDWSVDDYYFAAKDIREYYRVARRRPEEKEYPVKVTVVMPSLNMAPYIRKSLDSVVNQTLREIEILCVDAGSTDGTLEILEEYAAADSRIRIIHSDFKSYGHQVNLGIEQAQGRYLGIVETDDYILPDMYESLYNIAAEHYIQTIKADFQTFYETESGEDRYILRPILNSLPMHYYNCVIDGISDMDVLRANNVPWAGLYEVAFLRKYDIRLNETPGASYQDNGLWFQVYSQASRVYFSNKIGYCLRRDNPNSSIYSKGKVYCMCDEYDFIREFLRKHPRLEKTYAPKCAEFRYKNYNWTLNRIGEEFKLDFLKRFAVDFRAIIDAGELDESLYTEWDLERIHSIVEDPVEFYYGKSRMTYEFFRLLPPERYPEVMQRWFDVHTHAELDLEDPKTFNEKIQWLKLYDSTPLKTRLSDKYLVRAWIEEKLGKEYLVPLLGVWDRFEDIDFDALPDQFVLKCNHASGYNIIVKDKASLDREEAKAQMDLWMKTNFALTTGLELHYGAIQPKIVAEEYIADMEGEIMDYRFFCFNGKPQYIWADIGSGTPAHRRTIFDLDWQKQAVWVNYPEIVPEPERPATLEKMTRLAEILAEGFAFVRVDFYSFGDRILFGEMTFTPQSGKGVWDPPRMNRVYGDLIRLPERKGELPSKSFAERGCERLPDPPFQPETDPNVLLRNQIRQKQRAEARVRAKQLKLEETYAEKSEINAKLQQTYAEKSELNARLQQTYAEKSELNAKLQKTYKEKAERGVAIKEQKRQLQSLQQEKDELRQELDAVRGSLTYRLGRMITWLPRKLRGLMRAR